MNLSHRWFTRRAQHPRKGRLVYKIRDDFGKSTERGVVQGESVRLESESPSIRRSREPRKSVCSRVHLETTVTMRRTQFILIACLAIAREVFGTQVYETPSDSSQQQWQPWKNQDSIQASNGEQEKYHPVTFDDPDTQQKESRQPLFYNANIQSGASGVADVIGQQQSIDSVIDNILVSNRQGRNLEGYDEIYSDPNVKNALQLGNDTIARTYIRDKLCSLGLMNCEDTEGRRPYYSPHRDIHPHDVIYAQPVTIKPVGRPLPAIPVKRPYGPAKPVPLLPSFGSPGLGPVYPGPGPTFGRPPPSFVGPYPAYKKPGLPPPYLSKPIYESGIDSEHDFEDKFIDKKVVLHQPTSSGVQQHVHHHYHHGEAGGIAHNPAVVASSPTLGGSGLGNYGYGNGGTYGSTFNDFEDYKKAFKIKTSTSNSGPTVSPSSVKGYADRYSSYEKPNGKQFASGGQFGANNQFLGNDGDYLFNNGADTSFGSTSYEDCVCVPYDQCATINHVGRKDDLYLAIDPRNLDKDIEAETDEVVITDGNGTMTVVRVPKGVNGTEQIEQTKNERTKEVAEGAEVTKRSRRDVKDVTKKDDQPEIQERLTIGTGNLDTSKLNVRPTWGVSFGLPQTGGIGPIAPHPGNPLGIPGYTPGHIGGQGINLGPVAVNPLVAVQVTKDEYGEKVIKPYVNLHVTPNPGLIHKLGHLLAYKKYGLHGGYYGGHYGGHYGVYAPHYHTHHEKPIYHYPSRPPFYPSPSYDVHHHEPTYHKPAYNGGYYPSYYKDDNGDYDDYDYSDDYQDDYYRSARARNASTTEGRQFSAKAPPKASSQGPIGGDERRKGGKITFSDRRRRDTTAFSETTSERRYGRPPACGSHHVCCQRSHIIGARPQHGQCGVRNTQGINGRIKTPSHVDGNSEFGEYPWQVAILKKDTTESIYVCGGTLISSRHIITAAHCVKNAGRDLRARLGEWDVNNDIEFYPYIERDIVGVFVHPEFYAGTLANDIAILKLDHDIDFAKNPHISPACLPNKHDDFTNERCWTTGWGKDAFGNGGKYQNILKEVDVPVVSNHVCEQQMRLTRLGHSFNLHPGFICAGGEGGKDACKGDGGGPMVCEHHNRWQLAGVVSWGIGCGQPNVPGVYTRVSYYLDWIRQIVDY